MLDFKRIKDTHTYDVIANSMHNIHCKFNLSVKKITNTVTDNASNFVKAFKFYDNAISSPNDQSNNEDISSFEECIDIPIISEDNNIDEISLPPQMRCCAHTLNLVALSDIKEIIQNCNNKNLKKIYRTTFAKLQSFWTHFSHS